jgi:hypothetical protein
LAGFNEAIASCYYAFWLFYFPHFPDLLRIAEAKIQSLDYELFDFLRDGKIKKVAKFIGVKSAVRLQMQFEKIMASSRRLGTA